MGLETVVYIGDLNIANPTNLDRKKYGDDHFRALKTGLLGSFPGWPGVVLARGTEAQGASVNDYVLTLSPAPAAYTTGVFVFKATHTNTGAVTLAINALAAKTLKDVEGNALAAGDIGNGTVVAAYYDGTDFFLVSASDRADRGGDTYLGTHDFTGGTLQVATQAPGDNTTKGASTAFAFAALALKADLASPAFTGVPTAPTASVGTNTTQLATTAFVIAEAFAAALPSQAGHAGKTIVTDGATASWQFSINHQFNYLVGVI